MTEGVSLNLSSYSASISGLGDAGYIRVRVHDDTDASDKCIGGLQTFVWGGTEVDGPELITILAKANLIGGSVTVVTSPVAVSGKVTIYKGDAYTVARGRPLEWNDTNSAWPENLSEADVSITLEVDDGAMVVIGSVVSDTQVRVEPTGEDTDLLDEGQYDYRVVATFDITGTGDDDQRVTLAAGKFMVLDREDE